MYCIRCSGSSPASRTCESTNSLRTATSSRCAACMASNFLFPNRALSAGTSGSNGLKKSLRSVDARRRPRYTPNSGMVTPASRRGSSTRRWTDRP